MAQEEEIKGIIFDLGNVVIDFDHMIAARRISPYTDMTAEEIFRFIFDSELTGLFEEGKISPEDFFLQASRILGLRINYETFISVWNEIFFLSEKNRIVHTLAENLRRKYSLAILSNVNILHFEYIRDNFQLYDKFDHVIASCHLKLKKPDPQIYRRALDIIKLPASQVFYTDDRPELVNSAQALGIKGCIFTGAQDLKHKLQAAGVGVN